MQGYKSIMLVGTMVLMGGYLAQQEARAGSVDKIRQAIHKANFQLQQTLVEIDKAKDEIQRLGAEVQRLSEEFQRTGDEDTRVSLEAKRAEFASAVSKLEQLEAQAQWLRALIARLQRMLPVIDHVPSGVE
jgi:chromosome segregation ATPase